MFVYLFIFQLQVSVRMWRKGNPRALLVGLQKSTATMENSEEVSQKIKNRTTIWPTNSTSGYLSKEIQNTNSERYRNPSVHCNVICNSQDIETAQVSISR